MVCSRADRPILLPVHGVCTPRRTGVVLATGLRSGLDMRALQSPAAPSIIQGVPYRGLVTRLRLLVLMMCAVAGAAAAAAASAPSDPVAVRAAVCSDFPNQAAAQAAANTRDADGDGVYCESLPCPCAGPGSSQPAPASPTPAQPSPAEPAPAQPAPSTPAQPAPAPTTPVAPAPQPASSKTCAKPKTVQDIGFSKTKYPTIKAHYDAALRAGWPKILVINRPGADARRDRLLRDVPTKEGYDRDEYPPAVGRGKYRKSLMRGTDPRGWKASVEYVPSTENQSHGATLGVKLRRFCDGTKFRYRFY